MINKFWNVLFSQIITKIVCSLSKKVLSDHFMSALWSPSKTLPQERRMRTGIAFKIIISSELVTKQIREKLCFYNLEGCIRLPSPFQLNRAVGRLTFMMALGSTLSSSNLFLIRCTNLRLTPSMSQICLLVTLPQDFTRAITTAQRFSSCISRLRFIWRIL